MSLLYVIDAYNITNHTQFLRRTRSTQGPIPALKILITTHRLTGSRKNKVIFVCDGYPKPSVSEIDDGSFEVIFSRNKTADIRIKEIIEKSSQPKNIIVVSDDREIRFFVRASGAVSLGVADFLGRQDKPRQKEEDQAKVTYSQMGKINKEFRDLWLS